MSLAEYVGRYGVRRSLRFELKPVAGTENFVYDAADMSEDLAEGLGTVKDVILAQHLSMMRRVFKALPDPLPEDPKAIVRAFRQDLDFPMLDNPNAYNPHYSSLISTTVLPLRVHDIRQGAAQG